MINIFQAKSREKTPIGGGEPSKSFQFILNSSKTLKKKSEPRKDERVNNTTATATTGISQIT